MNCREYADRLKAALHYVREARAALGDHRRGGGQALGNLLKARQLLYVSHPPWRTSEPLACTAERLSQSAGYVSSQLDGKITELRQATRENPYAVPNLETFRAVRQLYCELSKTVGPVDPSIPLLPAIEGYQ